MKRVWKMRLDIYENPMTCSCTMILEIYKNPMKYPCTVLRKIYENPMTCVWKMISDISTKNLWNTYEAPMRDHMENPMENDPLGHCALGARVVASIHKPTPRLGSIPTSNRYKISFLPIAIKSPRVGPGPVCHRGKQDQAQRGGSRVKKKFCTYCPSACFPVAGLNAPWGSY